MTKEYFFISDLHLGAGEFKTACTCENELIKFLQSIENKNAELIIVGDFFGFWELNKNVREDKLEHIIKINKNIFNQFKKSGKKIKITIISGNHDYELTYNPKYSRILKKYNLVICKDEHLVKSIKGKKIWIEHGHQHDEYNKIVDFGNDKIKPLSYYATRELMSELHNKKSSKDNWIKDIQSIQPREYIPNWLASNYFYKELNPILRYILLPFLLFFTFSFFVLIAGYLSKFNLITIPFLTADFSQYFGIFGDVFDIIIFINTLIISVMLLLLIPITLLYKDFKKKFSNFGFTTEHLKQVKWEKYFKVAKETFRKHKGVNFFVFGHIHTAFMKKIDNKIVINTGTWIKKLKRIKPPKLFILPSVYYPHYKLTITHIFHEKNKIVATSKHIDKCLKPSFTWLQKLAIFFVRYKKKKEITRLTIDLS